MASPVRVIAIDGPSGAGKGTVARTIARRLDCRHIDTGAMYRAVAWKALSEGLDLSDGAAVADLADRAAFDLHTRVLIDGDDVTAVIRTPAIDEAAATVAGHPAVRAALVARQREYGRAGTVVMEGRDIGTVVFPEAAVKLYLDASPEERAHRRSRDASHAASRDGAVDRVAQALQARDHADRTRTVSPLALAPDAVYIDTTGMSIDAVVEKVMSVVNEKFSCLH